MVNTSSAVWLYGLMPDLHSASLMLKQGIHPKIVQERLGHSTIAMTLDIYSHVAPGIQEAAAESFDTLFSKERYVKVE